ncbi:MAG: hypothetical protein J6S14_14780 [Clostridia bacterium]|nr:hypothetical protein [Clostridia bacterium]
MFEKVINVFRILAGLSIAVGLVIMFGTAGASDINNLPVDEIIDNLTTAFVFFGVGAFVLWVTHE